MPRGPRDRADRKILRRAGDGGELRRGAGLSPSRFLHLFKEATGISFRSFRAWKRARHLLHANQDINLAHLAQDIGYPDSTHFSHSIRRFYGLKPRAIFSGSRDLAIYSCARVNADNSAWTQSQLMPDA
jgi:AraC-like DNA-binding protein